MHASQDMGKSRSQARLEPSRNATGVAASYAYGEQRTPSKAMAYYGAGNSSIMQGASRGARIMGSRRMTQSNNMNIQDNYGAAMNSQSNSQTVLNDLQRHLREIQNPSNIDIPDSKAYLTESR